MSVENIPSHLGLIFVVWSKCHESGFLHGLLHVLGLTALINGMFKHT